VVVRGKEAGLMTPLEKYWPIPRDQKGRKGVKNWEDKTTMQSSEKWKEKKSSEKIIVAGTGKIVSKGTLQ